MTTGTAPPGLGARGNTPAQWREQLRDAQSREGADAAASIASAWLDAFPRAPEPILYLGRYYQGREEWMRAEGFLQRFLRVRAGHGAAWFDLGSVRAQRGDLDGAIEAFYTAVRCAPRLQKARSRLYFVLRDCGRLEEAREVGVQWSKDFPDSQWQRKSVAGDALARPRLLGIMESLKRRDIADAEQKLSLLTGREDVARLFPKNAWLKLTMAFRMRRRIATAITCCDIGLSIDPSDRTLLSLRANFALRAADFATACGIVQNLLLSGEREDTDLWTNMALGLLQQDGGEARGRRALAEAVGRREEGDVHRVLFGNASPMVPFFGASIEQAFA
jgi:tetratricopeptide (TPR) repeat protein